MSEAADRLYEAVLVLRCQTGDEAAFAELVERYQTRLRYYLRKLLADTHAAEDALQEVWLDVFRAVARLADVHAFRGWLYRIAHDRAMRELRKRPRPRQPLPEVDPIDPKTEEDTFTADDVKAIHVALDELAAEQREVLVLRYVEDMRYEEIAGVVGCQIGTVRSRLHYAKRALRKLLERTKLP